MIASDMEADEREQDVEQRACDIAHLIASVELTSCASGPMHDAVLVARE